MVIADEEGIVVLPKEQKQTHYELARQVAEKEKNFVFGDWQKEHYLLIEDAWRWYFIERKSSQTVFYEFGMEQDSGISD